MGNLSISNCSSGSSGGFLSGSGTFNLGNLSISNCSSGSGGGVFYTPSSTVRINNNHISDCFCLSSGGCLHLGGSGTLFMEDVTAESCSCDCADADFGGGFLFVDSSPCELSRCLFRNCRSSSEGGCVCVSYSTNSSCISICDCRAVDCFSGTRGGGFYVHRPNGVITLANLSCSGCSCVSVYSGQSVHVVACSGIEWSNLCIPECGVVIYSERDSPPFESLFDGCGSDVVAPECFTLNVGREYKVRKYRFVVMGIGLFLPVMLGV